MIEFLMFCSGFCIGSFACWVYRQNEIKQERERADWAVNQMLSSKGMPPALRPAPAKEDDEPAKTPEYSFHDIVELLDREEIE